MALIDKDIIKRMRHNSMHDADFERLVETYDRQKIPVAMVNYTVKSGDTTLLMSHFIHKRLDKRGKGNSFREELTNIKDQLDFDRFIIP